MLQRTSKVRGLSETVTLSDITQNFIKYKITRRVNILIYNLFIKKKSYFKIPGSNVLKYLNWKLLNFLRKFS